MGQFTPQNPDFETMVRESFARQQVMNTIGARMARVIPGEVIITLPYRGDLTQQHGFLHAGVVSTIVDSAAGYAAFSLMALGAGVLTIEYKVNFLAPAAGAQFIAIGRVIKPGRTVTVCSGDVYALQDGETVDTFINAQQAEGIERPGKLVVTMQATIMSIREREGIVG